MTDAAGAELPAVAGTTNGWRLERQPDGMLDFIAADGTRHADVDIRRGFPLSAPEEGLAIVAASGGELALLESLAAVAGPLRRLLDVELARREFVPLIERIDSISEVRPAEWNVVTDRGPHRFSVAHPDDISRRPEGVFVTDTHGIRYRIVSEAALDPLSRRLLERRS